MKTLRILFDRQEKLVFGRQAVQLMKSVEDEQARQKSIEAKQDQRMQSIEDQTKSIEDQTKSIKDRTKSIAEKIDRVFLLGYNGTAQSGITTNGPANAQPPNPPNMGLGWSGRSVGVAELGGFEAAGRGREGSGCRGGSKSRGFGKLGDRSGAGVLVGPGAVVRKFHPVSVLRASASTPSPNTFFPPHRKPPDRHKPTLPRLSMCRHVFPTFRATSQKPQFTSPEQKLEIYPIPIL